MRRVRRPWRGPTHHGSGPGRAGRLLSPSSACFGGNYIRQRDAVWIGGRSRIRTYDPLIKSQLLYQLSYAPAKGAAYSNPLTACEAPAGASRHRERRAQGRPAPMRSRRSWPPAGAGCRLRLMFQPSSRPNRVCPQAERRPVVSCTGASFPPAASAMTDRSSRRKDEPFSVR